MPLTKNELNIKLYTGENGAIRDIKFLPFKITYMGYTGKLPEKGYRRLAYMTVAEFTAFIDKHVK